MYKPFNGNWRRVYETPTGVRVAKTKRGYCPVTRDGQIINKRRYGGNVNGCEVWEHHGKKKKSIRLKLIEEAE